MCGIFGAINFDKTAVDRERVIESRDVLSHRGPDEKGLYVSPAGNAALAHRRLSIIDLSPLGNQPMTTDGGRYTIVFNGEIYNYRAIKEEKLRRNKFVSGSDTEVLLALYALEGPSCLKRLRGMFAFAIWDEKEKKLFAARDRFGIKPFYYLLNGSEFVFSSELKAVRRYKGNLTVSMKGIDAFLKTGSVPAPLTIYTETASLLPGHYMEVDCHGSVKVQRYWRFDDLLIESDSEFDKQGRARPTSGNGTKVGLEYDDSARRRIREALLDTINAHLVSDVEVGAFLSGGIDSTAIVSLMRQAGHKKVKTVSVTFPGNKLDESKYSRLAADRYNTDHLEYKFGEQELIDDFEKILDTIDQPTIDGINTYFVSKAARKSGLKVVMSGLGGDELFGGYPTFRNIPRIGNYLKYKRAVPFANSAMGLTAKIAKRKIPAKGREFLSAPDDRNAGYRLFRGLFTNAELDELGWNYSFPHPFGSRDCEGFSNEEPGESSATALAPLQHVSSLESTYYMRNQLLRDSDVFSMVHSIELRVPFVDHPLYESVLPYLPSGYDKDFQKKMLVEGVGDLPKEIVFRPKMGFTFPFADWISGGKLKASISDALKSSRLSDVIEGKKVTNVISRFETGGMHWSRVWTLFILSKFL